MRDQVFLLHSLIISGGGELGKGETGKGCGQEAGEKGGEVWDAPPELGGRSESEPIGLQIEERITISTFAFIFILVYIFIF